MSLSDHYPTMSPDSCDYNGMWGNCGPDCIALHAGNCPDAGKGDLRIMAYIAEMWPESLLEDHGGGNEPNM